MKLAIVIGSVREGRKTPQQAQWVLKTAQQMAGVEAEIVDLKDYPMPFMAEPISPRYNPNRQIDPAVKPWLDKLNQFDAYVFVTPEYNHSIPGVLKNALDYVTWELQRKPSLMVGHGTVGGARAIVQLREILAESRSMPIPQTVSVPGMSELIDEEGNLSQEALANPYGPQNALQTALDELQWCSNALAAARAQTK